MIPTESWFHNLINNKELIELIETKDKLLKLYLINVFFPKNCPMNKDEVKIFAFRLLYSGCYLWERRVSQIYYIYIIYGHQNPSQIQSEVHSMKQILLRVHAACCSCRCLSRRLMLPWLLQKNWHFVYNSILSTPCVGRNDRWMCSEWEVQYGFGQSGNWREQHPTLFVMYTNTTKTNWNLANLISRLGKAMANPQLALLILPSSPCLTLADSLPSSTCT